MSCEQFERWLHQEWEQHRRPGERATERPGEFAPHAEACDACRDRLAAHQQLWDGFAQMESPALPAGFAESVIARFAQTNGEFDDSTQSSSAESIHQTSAPPTLVYKPRWSNRQVAIWLQVAAALLLAAFTVLWRGGDSVISSSVTPSGASDNRVGNAEDANPIGDSGEPEESSIVESGEPSGSGSGSGSGRASRWNPASELQSMAMFFLSPPDLKTVVVLVNRRVREFIGDPARRVNELPGSLQQVARSVNVTIDILRQALPGGTQRNQAQPAPDSGENTPSSDEPERRDVGRRELERRSGTLRA